MPSKRPVGGSSSDVTTNPSKRQKTAEKIHLTNEEKEELRQWLDKRESNPTLTSVFKVDTFPVPTRKGGKKYTGAVEQLSLGGHDHMAVAYSVTPAKQWNQLWPYRKFTLPNGETYEPGSCVLVKHSNSGDDFDVEKQWKAQVLEIRALDANHVYLRIAWLEIPRDISCLAGKKTYHASNELVVSNEMYIIDAQTVNGGLDIVYWDETNDEVPPPAPDVYFWRQQYDKHTNTLSRLTDICKCETPHNPNDLILRCNSCTQWLHARCIIEAAEMRERANDVDERAPNGNIKSKQSKHKKVGKVKKQKTGEVAVDISVPDGGKPKLLITEKTTGHTREEVVHCLLCEQDME